MRPARGGKITIHYIPRMVQIRRVPTGRSFSVPGQDWSVGGGPCTILLPTARLCREYRDVKVRLSEEEICEGISTNHGYDLDGDGWYWLDFYIGEFGPYKLAYRRDQDFSRWFVEELVDCARKGGGSWAVSVSPLRRDANGTHWYVTDKDKK